jgi:phytoene synthase
MSKRAPAPSQAGSRMREATTPEVKQALQECCSMIQKGSKSFSLAARLFDQETREAAVFLYGWCRYCDDQVDQAGRGERAQDLERRLRDLKEMTRSAFAGEAQREAVFIALQYIVHRYSIPAHYAFELIEGMAMDARGTRYENLSKLLVYCYRVAGTVGLMMSHVMGVRDEKALEHAAKLGIAMQLTNIARDVLEDAQMERIYLPMEWLREANIPPEEIALPMHRQKLALVVRQLLQAAERYYRAGDEGFWHLSFRSACAVAVARHVYAEIGSQVLKQGCWAWDQRAHVRGGRKLWAVARGIRQVLTSIPARAFRPWSPAPIRIVWRSSEIG